MAYVIVDSNGKPTGFYDTQVDGSVEVSDADKAALIAGYPRKGYVDGVVIDLSDSTVFTLTQVKENKWAEINAGYERAAAAVKAGVPGTEISSWTKQETEARAYLADSTATTPLIDALATSRGYDKEALVLKIIEKADAYAATIGNLTGLRQKYEDQFEVCSTADEYLAITVTY